MASFDFSPLFRSTIGFDELVGLLDSVKQDSAQPAYPPYNIERVSENDYRISMAIAGFKPEELNIEAKANELTVSGKHEAPAGRKYLHQGIANRSFERRFKLADHVRVTNATIEHGLLHVDLVREIPEALKPRQIEINTGAATPRQIENATAAA
ncbi:MAG: Hsp20 family protein [Parvibaculaceae bacterium]|nr:Hsp20 family protein [Parvibaculaceae bacterium]